jgi:Lecithin retinol acyltransferase
MDRSPHNGLPKIGDHLISRRPGFMHHGIYVGHERVIHYGGNSTGITAKVEEVTLQRFAGVNGFQIVPYRRRRFSREESVRRAYTRFGEDHYCVVSNNCQHFVEWCVMGIHRSGQVAARTGVAAGAVAAAGAVSGLTAPGIASGLSAIGTVAGGAAAAGIVVGAAPALAMTGLLTRTIYRQNPCQPKSERMARRIGAATTAAVGMAGAASIIGAPGLATAASPAIAAAAIGYGAYRVSRRLLRRVDKRPLDALPPPAA